MSQRWALLTVLTAAYGMGAFGMLGASPLTPSLVDGFALTRLDVAFIVPSVYVGGLLFSLPGGHLADRWGVHTNGDTHVWFELARDTTGKPSAPDAAAAPAAVFRNWRRV